MSGPITSKPKAPVAAPALQPKPAAPKKPEPKAPTPKTAARAPAMQPKPPAPKVAAKPTQAPTRDSVQEAIKKVDRELVDLLKTRLGLVKDLAPFDADTKQAEKFMSNAREHARNQKLDLHIVEHVMTTISLDYNFAELQARVGLAVKAFEDADFDTIAQRKKERA